MEIVIEIIEQGQRKSRIERIDTDCFSIGRSWNADIIIQDPEIDAEHLWVELENTNQQQALPSLLRVSDCNTVNGSKLEKQKLEKQQPVNWGQWISIGSTQICLHSMQCSVPMAKRRKPIDILVANLQLSWVALGLMMLSILNLQYTAYLNRAFYFDWENIIQDVISSVSSLLAWAVIWGCIARLTKQQFQIWLHLSLASVALISYAILNEASIILSFNFLSTFWQNWSPTLISLLIGISWLLFVLYVGTGLKAKKRLGITAAVVFLYLLPTQILPMMRSDNWVARPQMVTVSRPANFLMTPKQNQTDFMNELNKLFDQAQSKAEEQRE